MSERAAVPPGKSIFYRSGDIGHRSSETEGGSSSDLPSVAGDALEFKSLKEAFYTRIEESLNLTLNSAIELLSLAMRSRQAAFELAEQILAEAQSERGRLKEENKLLSLQLVELNDKLSEVRSSVELEEERLRSLLQRRQMLEAEVGELERRRAQVVESLREQLEGLRTSIGGEA